MTTRSGKTQTPVYLSEAERAYAALVRDLVPGPTFGVAAGTRFAIRYCQAQLGSDPAVLLAAIRTLPDSVPGAGSSR